MACLDEELLTPLQAEGILSRRATLPHTRGFYVAEKRNVSAGLNVYVCLIKLLE